MQGTTGLSIRRSTQNLHTGDLLVLNLPNIVRSKLSQVTLTQRKQLQQHVWFWDYRYVVFSLGVWNIVRLGQYLPLLGLGSIGHGMAKNLRQKLPSSTTLHVYDINEQAVNRLVTEYGSYGKIQPATSAKILADQCDTILSSVPNGTAVRSIFMTPETGIIAATRNPNRLIIECSTIEIESVHEIGKSIIDAGLGTYVDSPVSGGIWGANDGTLSFMVGHAEPSDKDPLSKRIVETLSLVGDMNVTNFCGGLGMGQVAKIAHNYVTLCNNVAATEGMALGLKYGIDKKVLWNVMTKGTANSWVMGFEQPVPGLVPDSPSYNGYKRAFGPDLSVKDLRIGIHSARRVELSPSAAETALPLFYRAATDERTKVSFNRLLITFHECLKELLEPRSYRYLATRQQHCR